ncbi:NAD-dependent epimerase/dehydratase family protein [Paenibacillus thailandensis]|uniref:NAD-dependent epimerase/dehydratase family protein n=1 Tax=Paenibacillus thailandensis TaxID=393250 RepID=A0ABW5QV88_9BACL
MKVLVTGGYGFIGSHVAERFYKEGYDVFIIDNLSTGNRSNVDFKHKGYILSAEDDKCEEVFRSNRFDAVVHLAAQVDVAESMRNPQTDSESNIIGLVNMLTLAQKYKARKFIFASSAAVYGANDRTPLGETEPGDPLSPYGISKLAGESYCFKWRELYGLDTLVFRFSNVYGPRQGVKGEGGVVSVFMDKLLAGEKLYINGDGKQTRDFIFVQDVADAIYRASYSSLSGVYNLSANTEHSILELIAMLESIHARPVEVEHREEREGDIRHSSLNNAKVCRDLDWAPLYTLREGLAKTYVWFQANKGGQEEGRNSVRLSKRLSALRPPLKKALPFIENGLAFAAMAWVTFMDWNELYSFMDLNIIYIFVMGILYGSRQSVVAAGLSILLMVAEQLEEGRELISLFYTTEFFFRMAAYLFIGLVIGYAIDRKNNILREQRRKNDELAERYRFLNEVYADVRSVKDDLQRRIMTSEESIGKIYSITKSLESLEPEQILSATVNVVSSTMDAGQVSIYSANKEGTYLRLIAGTEGSDSMPKSIKVADSAFLSQVMRDGRIFRNKTLQEDAPLMAAPIRSGGATVAVIAIDGMPFHKFTMYQENLFRVVAELVTSSFTRAMSYISAMEEKRYVEGTALLRPEAFNAIIEAKRASWNQHGIPYLLMRGTGQGPAAEFADKAAKLLRETDYIGLNEQGRVLLLLSNTSQRDAGQVVERFHKNGLAISLAEEEAAYA